MDLTYSISNKVISVPSKSETLNGIESCIIAMKHGTFLSCRNSFRFIVLNEVLVTLFGFTLQTLCLNTYLLVHLLLQDIINWFRLLQVQRPMDTKMIR